MMRKLHIIIYFTSFIYIIYCAFNPQTFHFIDSINLIFHEAGHTIFFFLPDILTAIAGSAFQIIVPIIISLYLYFKNENVGGSIILLWVGQSVINVSTYARDAIKMQLELLGGSSVNHDWNFIFTNLHILKYSEKIGAVIYFIGLLIILISIIVVIKYILNFKKIIVIENK